jgi:hypothetical protein
MIFDKCLWPLVLIELLFEFFFIHNCPAWSVSISYFILAFISLVTIFKTSLASDNAWSFCLIWCFLHLYYWKAYQNIISDNLHLCSQKSIEILKISETLTFVFEHSSYCLFKNVKSNHYFFSGGV